MAAESTQDHYSSSCSSSFSASRYNHDVFLSFRGEDTRKNFTDHLYTALDRVGIRTFRDDDNLPRGEDISLELLKAIQESRISIIVFSERYASSGWCLDELVKILECKKTMCQLVIPIFYNIDPSIVRHQTKSFGEAFAKHEKRFKDKIEKVQRWRAALTEAANLSGWDLQNVADGHESKFIQKIVEEVLCKVNRTYLNVATYQVGIDSRVEDINSLLRIGSDGVRLIGIFGMGGIGKTTIAKAVYNLNFHGFQGSCFLANVREVSGTLNGLLHLQEQLLSEVLMEKDLDIRNVDRGITLMKERLHSKRVLIVLDDLDELSQLNSLAGNRDWFGSESRIIITTRDVHLLNKLEVDERYKVEELNHYESMQLFSWHAFRETIPLDDYAKLSNDIVSYAGGLPLALEVLGSYLLGRNLLEWRSAFEKLQQIPHNKIQKILRLSFDALEDDKLKDIFLDIACFFIGMNQDYVVNILNGCGFFSEIGISILTSRCLLTINENKELRMHDLTRDMGREIIREESPKEPGQRSRLWFHKDACAVLEKQKGTKAIEGVALVLPTLKEVHLNTKAFARMHNLRLLQINNVHLTGSHKHLFEELRWLYWLNCPLRYLPSNFHLENLVVLDMQYSNIEEVWEDIKFVGNLKILNLSHSKCLRKTPDFTGVPRLERLLLEECRGLLEVHQSIGDLDGLLFLNLKNCKNIRNLPSSIWGLKSLAHLDLTGCSALEGLPELLGKREGGLTKLSLQGCSRKLARKSRLSLLPSIRYLSPSILDLCSLRILSLRNCNLSEGDIPVELRSLASLETLDLSESNFRSLPSSISHLSSLVVLGLDRCTSLQSLREFPPNLWALGARGCTSLEKLPNLSNFKTVRHLSLDNCDRLAEIQGGENLDCTAVNHKESFASKLADTFIDIIYKEHSKQNNVDFYFPSKEIPKWFSHQRMGSSISFHVPLHVEHQFLGMTLWAVYAAEKVEDLFKTLSLQVVISNRTNGSKWTHKPALYSILVLYEGHSWVSHLPKSYFRNPIKGGERIKVCFNMEAASVVKKCGIHLVYKPDNIIEDDDQGQSSCVNTNKWGELMDNTHPKRGRDLNAVGTSLINLPNMNQFPKRMVAEYFGGVFL